jgi:hypothetical protein
MFNSRCLSFDKDGNLTTGLAKVNYTNGLVDFSECSMWNYNPLMYTYSPVFSLNRCLGPQGIQICNRNTLWRHYEDGLLSNVESTYCLNGIAAAVPCTAGRIRIDKLWNRGFKAINELATNSTNVFLQGQMFYQNLMGFRFFSDSQHKLTFQVFDYNRPKDIKYYVWNTGIYAKEATFLRLLSNGLSANATVINRPDGNSIQNRKLPYQLVLNSKSLMIKDANWNSIWFWNFRL